MLALVNTPKILWSVGCMPRCIVWPDLQRMHVIEHCKQLHVAEKFAECFEKVHMETGQIVASHLAIRGSKQHSEQVGYLSA